MLFADVRIGKCWTKQVGGVCEKNVNGDVTKAVCCSTFGVAWGSPCESCADAGNIGGILFHLLMKIARIFQSGVNSELLCC